MTSTTSFDPGFTTPQLAEVFSAAARVRAMVRFERALTGAQAAVGIAPAGVALQIGRVDVDDDRAEELLARGWESGSPVLELLDVLRDQLDEDAAAWLHRGATSQDVLDTATMLQLRSALGLVGEDLRRLAQDLQELTAQHRDTPARAWTLLQPAVPTTAGLRFARWLAPVVEHLRELHAASTRLPVQLGGPSGTLHALDTDATALVAALAKRLGLAVPLLPWHTDRGPIERVVALLLRIARTMGSIGTDVALLCQQGEVEVRSGGSSSMPDKHNPIDAVRAVAAAEACGGAATGVLAGRSHELERAAGGWQAEWFAVPLVAQTAGAAVAATGRAVASLAVTGTAPDEGPTASSATFVDRVLTAADEVL